MPNLMVALPNIGVAFCSDVIALSKIHDIDNLRKCLMQTWFDFDQDITDATIDQWCDHLRSYVCADGGHFEHTFTYMIHRNVF